MAGRTSQAGRRSAAQKARAEVARARRRAGTAPARPPARRWASFGFIGAGVAGLWMGSRTRLGWVVRAIGRKAATARELDREHQRDGGGLLLIGVAIVLAVAVWFNGAGPFGAWLASTTRLGGRRDRDGAAAAAARRRRPADARAGRGGSPAAAGLVGWTSLVVASAGLLHLGKNAAHRARV